MKEVMNKEKFQPVCMKCSREQLDRARPILEAHGLRMVMIDNVHYYDHLVNNLLDIPGRVSNYERSTDYGRAVVDEWDLDLFLQYCGIENK